MLIASTASNKAEKDYPDNLSLAGDGFDTVMKAKAAVDAVPQCRNRVSCADILVMATRDAISMVSLSYSAYLIYTPIIRVPKPSAGIRLLSILDYLVAWCLNDELVYMFARSVRWAILCGGTGEVGRAELDRG